VAVVFGEPKGILNQQMIASLRTTLTLVLSLASGGLTYAQVPAPASIVPSVTTADSDSTAFAGFPTPAVDAAFLPLHEAWPPRWGRDGLVLQGIVIDVPSRILRPEGTRLGFALPGLTDVEVPDAAALKQSCGITGLLNVELEGLGGFRITAEPRPEGKKVPRKRQYDAAATFRFVSAQGRPDREGRPTIALERTWFSYFEPMSGAAPPDGEGAGLEGGARVPTPRGVALLMPGLFGTPEGTLDLLTLALRRRGWGVLRMLSQPGRFTERVTLGLLADDLPGAATQIAEVVGGRAAECAYAVQAAFAHLEDLRPELKGLPSVALGCSGGAMTLPTVAAREPDRYAAAVLIGGGADYWLMSEHSNYRNWIDAMRIAWIGEEPAVEDRVRLDSLYLGASPLDSYHTAAALLGKPMLVIQGTLDMAVPSPLGDVLWERLGRPERWLRPAGHEVLFMNLPGEYEKIMVWLDGTVPLGSAVGPP